MENRKKTSKRTEQALHTLSSLVKTYLASTPELADLKLESLVMKERPAEAVADDTKAMSNIAMVAAGPLLERDDDGKKWYWCTDANGDRYRKYGHGCP